MEGGSSLLGDVGCKGVPVSTQDLANGSVRTTAWTSDWCSQLCQLFLASQLGQANDLL